RYLGRAAHAGGAPHMGINALYAAQIGLMAINSIRETFRDEDTIRVHPIITHGGSQVNVIPGEVRIETYVRGRTMEAIVDANVKVDRALRAGALALGAKVEIETLPGYMPMTCDPIMTRYFRDNVSSLFGAEHYRQIGHRTGSTDMGDLSQVMPILHPYIGGARGTGHGADFVILHKPLAYLGPAKALAAIVVDMLWDGAAAAREVTATFKLEKILALEPDLVLAFSDLQRDVVRDLIGAGVSVLCTNQRSFDDVLDAILLIGGALGCERQARELIADLRDEVRQIREYSAVWPDRPRVYFEEWM